MIGGGYSPCSWGRYHDRSCEHASGYCNDHMLTRPQCFACLHFRQNDRTCTFYGWIDSACGCCSKYEHSPLEWCVNGWAHRRDWGLDCGWIDTIGCEKCQEQYFEQMEEE